MDTPSQLDVIRAEVLHAVNELDTKLSKTWNKDVLREALAEVHVVSARIDELLAAADDIEDIFS